MRWKRALLLSASAGLFFASAAALGDLAGGGAFVSALRNPFALIAERSPGGRGAGALQSTKPERTAAIVPHERVLSGERERNPPADVMAPMELPDFTTAGAPGSDIGPAPATAANSPFATASSLPSGPGLGLPAFPPTNPGGGGTGTGGTTTPGGTTSGGGGTPTGPQSPGGVTAPNGPDLPPLLPITNPDNPAIPPLPPAGPGPDSNPVTGPDAGPPAILPPPSDVPPDVPPGPDTPPVTTQVPEAPSWTLMLLGLLAAGAARRRARRPL